MSDLQLFIIQKIEYKCVNSSLLVFKNVQTFCESLLVRVLIITRDIIIALEKNDTALVTIWKNQV